MAAVAWLDTPRVNLFLCVVAGLLAFTPFLLVEHPPTQDLPFHLATLRIIHSIHDPSFGFANTFELHLLGTPYAVFYLIGDVLAYPLGLRGALLALIAAHMVGTVLGTRALLRALGNDERLALLVAPMLVNCLLIMGFFPYLLGVTILLFGLAAVVTHLREQTVKSGLKLGAIAILLFYTHIIPLALLGVGALVTFSWRPFRRDRYVRSVAPFVPVTLIILHWFFFTESGKFVRRGVLGEESDRWRFDVSLHNIYAVTFDMYPDSADERAFTLVLAIAVLATLFAGRAPDAPRPPATNWKWRWALVPLVCTVMYFVSEGSVGYTGFLRDRYPLVALLCVIPLLRYPKRLVGHLTTLAIFITLAMTVETNVWHFQKFQDDEVADFDRAVAMLPPDRHVMGLIFDSTSKRVERYPFLHYVSLYQAQKGGVVQYSFADIPHWVFRFKPHVGPPLATPKRKWWEWEPTQVSAEEELNLYYDYVIVRSDTPKPPPREFRVLYESGPWTIWERRPS